MRTDERTGGVERRRILHVITTLEPAGAQTLLLDLAARLDPARFAVTIAHLRRPRRMPVLAPRASAIRTIDLSRGGRFDPLVVPRLRALIRRERTDLVHTHLVHAGIAGKLAAFAEHLPVVATRHYASEAKSSRWDYRWEDRLTGRADRVIAVSNAVRSYLIARRVVPDERIRVIPNAIDLERFDPARVAPITSAIPASGLHTTKTAAVGELRSSPAPGPVIGCVGRLAPQKGQDLLLRAFARLRETTPARLELVGEGPSAEALVRQAAALQIAGSVHFHGAVSPDRLPSLLAGWDLFVLPSRWEAFGLALLEAMAMARPIVASAVEGVVELVTPGGTGLLVPPDDEEALTAALRRMLGDPIAARAMGERARESALSRYGIDDAVRAVADLYNELLDPRIPGSTGP